MNVLGIETSCDETAAAIVTEAMAVRSSVIASQAELHAKYGGVVPEVASRMHVERVLPVVKETLALAGIGYGEVDAVAVTNRPGLLGALLVGVSAAKALAFSLHLPIVGVHHIEGHLYSNFLADPALGESFPLLCLVASGGHTQIYRMNGHGDYTLLGRTRDDAAGEAFDKGARLFGLPYPGGPHLSRLAENGDPHAVPFPRSWLGDSLDFSFSGLKTSLRNYLLKNEARESEIVSLENIAASYEEAIADVLTEKMLRAARREGIHTLCAAGGVASNRRLKRKLAEMCARNGFRLVMPPGEYCTDNAAMIAAAGVPRLRAGSTDALTFDTFASQPLAKPAESLSPQPAILS